MTATLSEEDQKFLAECEEEFKDRYTEKDEEFMKVYNSEPPEPPIIENWSVSNNYGRRNDHRNNRRFHPYDRHGNRDRGYQNRGHQDRGHSRGYNDYQDYDDNRQRRRYY